VIDDVEVRPQFQSAIEILDLRKLYPNAQLLLTSRMPIEPSAVDLQLSLGGLSQHEFEDFLKGRLGLIGDQTMAEKLYRALAGHPLGGAVVADLIANKRLTPREIFERLQPFARSGIFDPTGQQLTPDSGESKQVVSDIVQVSDAFLRKLKSDPKLLYDLSPRKFEEVVAELLNKLDYEVTLTPASKDGGKDIYAAKKDYLGTFLFIVECKKYAPDRPIGVGLVRQLNGVVQAEQATAGILATTSFFTRGAKEFQRKIAYQISLKDYFGIQAWLDEIPKV
jgi:restriction system protein